MKKRKHHISSYEELISVHYGHHHRSHHDKKHPAKAVVLAKSFDNGELLPQQASPDNALPDAFEDMRCLDCAVSVMKLQGHALQGPTERLKGRGRRVRTGDKDGRVLIRSSRHASSER